MGIIGYGTYVPRFRLERRAIRDVLDTSGGSGTRSVASYDEDTTTLGVEAARRALAPLTPIEVGSVAFATSRPAYLDKTNATAIHAALALPPQTDAMDCIGSPKSAFGAWHVAAATNGLAVMSDLRYGRPGSTEELLGGDAAAAFVLGADAASIAIEIGAGSAVGEFMDRWRGAGSRFVESSEERFGEHAYGPLVKAALDTALRAAGITPGELDHVIVAGLHTRAVANARRSLGFRAETLVDDHADKVGNTGCAQPWVMLASALDRAAPDETILVLSLGDGCTAKVLRTTAMIAGRSHRSTTDAGLLPVSYADMLTWRSLLEREPPRRPRPDQPAAPPAARSVAWKFGFFGSVDERGNVHVPPSRVSAETGSVDKMTPVRLADRQGTIVNFTVDRLAYSLSPPVIVAIVDFDGGGRYQCELTDADPDSVQIGQRVEMTFRNLHTEGGIHNYFWKARPVAD